MTTDLNTTEQHRRDELIATVRRTAVHMVDCLHALKELKDDELWRETHDCWSDFAAENFDFTVRHLDRLLQVNEIREQHPELTSDRAARELAPVADDIREDVIRHAVESGGPVTSAAIKESRQAVESAIAANEGPLPFTPIDPDTGYDEYIRPLDEILSHLIKAHSGYIANWQGAGFAHMPHQRIKSQMNQLISDIKSHFPMEECPMCNVDGCRLCKGTGWITEDQHDRLRQSAIIQ